MLVGLLTAPAAAQEIGRLYAARPPQGYAFVRIATADVAARVDLVRNGQGATEIGGATTATRYRAVPGDKALTIAIDGAMLDLAAMPRPDEFSTVVIHRDATGWRASVISEGQANLDDLKAQLRFFNLAGGCDATLKVAGGPQIFAATAPATVRARAVNPVRADVEAGCGDRTATLALPQLRPGDHFSMFLRAVPGAGLALSGQFDETEPFRE
jgi:hypothetical protein